MRYSDIVVYLRWLRMCALTHFGCKSGLQTINVLTFQIDTKSITSVVLFLFKKYFRKCLFFRIIGYLCHQISAVAR